MGTKNYTIIISIFFIVLLMSADQQNNKPFPGLVPAPANIEYLDTEIIIHDAIELDYDSGNKYLTVSLIMYSI